MRPRSITGPLLLILVGIVFLIRNLRPDFSIFALIADYWPFLLIVAGIIGLLEVLYYASRGVNPPPRPLGGGWIFLIVILCIFAGVIGNHRTFRFNALDSSGVTLLGSDYEYDLTPAGSPQVLSQGVTRIVLDNVRGNISLKGDDSADVKVSGHRSIRAFSRDNASRANQQSRIQIDREGDALMIRATAPNRMAALQISNDLDISVPKGLSVEARGRSGDLTIDDVTGGVDVSNGRGDVRLSHIGSNVKIESSRSGMVRATDLKGNFDLQGRGSDIQLENIAGEVTINGDYSGTLEFHALARPMRFESSRTEFHVEAVPGTITLDLGELKMSNVSGPVRFQTGTRDIEVTDVTNALDISVERGDVRVIDSQSPLPKIDIHTHNGEIALSIPDKAGFQLSGSTAQGDVNNEYGSQLQTQVNGRSSTIQGQTGTGPLINVTTDRGNVSVKKL